MRIIFLNTWQGGLKPKLARFIKSHASVTDIFCLEEARKEDLPFYKSLLPGYKTVYVGKKYKENVYFGQLILVKKAISVTSSRKLFADKRDSGLVILANLKNRFGELAVCNVHGSPEPGSKLDTPKRIRQTKAILNLLKGVGLPKIIGGDFNLLPDTESIKMFERAGYRNLIRDYKIKSTRNELSWNFHAKNNGYFVKQFFADYAFVSNDVKVKAFEVPNIKISDHLPLILDFEV